MDRKKSEVNSKNISAFFISIAKALRLVYRSSPLYTTILALTKILDGISPAISVYLSKLVLDNVVLTIKTPSPENINGTVFIIVCSYLFDIYQNLLGGISDHIQMVLKDIFQSHISKKILDKAVSLDLSFFENGKFYDKLEKVSRQVNYRPVQILNNVFNLISSTFTVISLLFVIAKLNTLFVALLVIVTVPRFIYRIKFSSKNYQITDSRVKESRKVNYISWLLTKDTAAAEIKIFNLAGHFLKKFIDVNNKFNIENKKLSAKQTTIEFFLDLIISLARGAIYLYSFFAAIKGKITIGDLSMFSQSASRMMGNLQGLYSGIASLYEHYLYLNDYFDFENFSPKIITPKNPIIPAQSTSLKIEFKDVSFRYDENKPFVLKNVNLTIEPSQNIAIVGENGAGKSTLIKLLLHLYEPEAGTIEINGINIKEISPQFLQENFSAIFQNYQSYLGTIEENIAFGNIAKVTDHEKVKAAAVLSGADKIVDKYKNKYQTFLGRWFNEEGEELSGGEWQKIALARAFFSGAKVLVMDEPTASLDPKSEFEVFEKLLEETKNKSLVLISHRFSTVRLADKIFVLENGQISESGSHDELMSKNGTYANLFNLQTQWYK